MLYSLFDSFSDQSLFNMGVGPVFLVLLLILTVGGFVAAMLTSPSHVSFSRKRKDQDFERHGLKSRRLLVGQFDGDQYGRFGDQVLESLKPGIWSWLGFSHQLKVDLPISRSGIPETEESKAFTFLSGQINGRHVTIDFFPHGPIAQTVSSLLVNLQEKSLGDVLPPPHYDCFDFPLSRLQGLTTSLSLHQRELLFVATAGIASRGFGVTGQLLSIRDFIGFAKKFDALCPHLKSTQAELYKELVVVTAWCYLMAGILEKKPGYFERALYFYELIDEFQWRERNHTEWAGIKANEALAVLMLLKLDVATNTPEKDELVARMVMTSLQGMRHFRFDNFPCSWGKMLTKLALADGYASRSFTELRYETYTEDVKSASVEKHVIEHGLEQAIQQWEIEGHDDLICEAFFALGRLAKNSCKRHMGLQGWERAESAFLASLSHSKEVTPWFVSCRADIQLELGHLYLDWGSEFGDRAILEKAIHYLSELKKGGSAVSEQQVQKAAIYYNCALLNLGGLVNDEALHRKAIFEINDLKDRLGSGRCDQNIERALSVARARLALCKRDKGHAQVAISEISAVIGQTGSELFPKREVLLRLRARLREMLFGLGGDEITLDRAIQDRRGLVNGADVSVHSLRWAVEVGELVRVLSLRQYRMSGGRDDFHEAHYLLKQAIEICNDVEGLTSYKKRTSVPHIQAGLYCKMGKLLATYARVQFDVSAFDEALDAYEGYLKLTPRDGDGLGRAHVLHEMGQILMDCSEHYGRHLGLPRAVACFAQAYDIYLEHDHINQASRMRWFMENAEAAKLAYRVSVEENVVSQLVR